MTEQKCISKDAVDRPRLDVFNYSHVTVCIYHAELTAYLFTRGRNVLGRTDKGAKRP